MFVMNNNRFCENSKIIEVTSGVAGVGCLKQSNLSYNSIVCLPLQLSFGDLKSLKNYDRSCLRKVYPEEDYYFFEEKFIFRKEMKELETYVKKSEKIRIWSSHKNTDEFLLLLYLCSLFPNQNISVVFADEYQPECCSIGCMDGKEVNELVKKEHILSGQEKEEYIHMWQEIVKVNSELRYIENGIVKSVDIDYFDEIILSHLKELEEVKIYTLIGHLMANFIIDDASDSIYLYLINRLINQGKIKVTKIENNKKIIKIVD